MQIMLKENLELYCESDSILEELHPEYAHPLGEKQKILLSNKFTEQLINTPETGMGYHRVDIYLKNGEILKNKIVSNCSVLTLENSVKLNIDEIEKIKCKNVWTKFDVNYGTAKLECAYLFDGDVDNIKIKILSKVPRGQYHSYMNDAIEYFEENILPELKHITESIDGQIDIKKKWNEWCRKNTTRNGNATHSIDDDTFVDIDFINSLIVISKRKYPNSLDCVTRRENYLHTSIDDVANAYKKFDNRAKDFVFGNKKFKLSQDKQSLIEYDDTGRIIENILPGLISKNFAPQNITHLKDGQIFVFGSNLAGRHGAGAAKLALDKFGAKYGQGVGLQGQSYAIPTKDKNIEALSLDEIKPYVNDFIGYTKEHKDLTFLVTEIGCGLAGYKLDQIAPLFKDAIGVQNIWLPKSFV